MRRGVGIDFGTTNSAVAVAEEGGRPALARFPAASGSGHAFRSLLYFYLDEDSTPGRPGSLAGPDGIARHLADEEPGRLIQSMKSFLASRHFHATRVFDATFPLEDLISLVIDGLRAAAEAQLGGLEGALVVGRPVRFVHARSQKDDEIAVSRLETALRRSGFARVELEYEPVAAAYHYERELARDELILIADFGGGTSDFSLVRVGPSQRGRSPAERDVLGTDGVAIAGDAFDGRIVQHLVAPQLGRNSRHRPLFGQEMPVPLWLYTHLERWHHVSFLKSRKTLGLLYALRRDSLEPEQLDGLIHLVENDLGYRLYEAVQRAKFALSQRSETRFQFRDDPIEIDCALTRADFEGWIAEEVAAIAACVDRLFERLGVGRGEVDRVFMTGGSSLVPAVRRVFVERFGAARIRGGEELTSVASGLALRALETARA
jgi:hypothetical chaperone protein